jgi:molybdopterin/thiamine biosynthesis adenylyltransferase
MEGDLYDRAFSRNIGVLTPEAQQLLKGSCIAIAGLGGAGGPAAEQLARVGAGHLKLAEPDFYEISNLNRQVGSSMSTIGKKKIDVIDNYLKDINPNLNIEDFPKGVGIENAEEFVRGADVVIEAVDYFAPGAKFAIHKAARAQGKYTITTPITGFGAVYFCFGPDTPRIEDVLEFPAMQKLAGSTQVLAKMLMGGSVDYLPKLYFEKVAQKENPYASTVSPAASIAGSVAATQTLKLLMQAAQEKDGSKFPDYGTINVPKVPLVMRIDAWDAEHCRVVNLEDIMRGEKWDLTK